MESIRLSEVEGYAIGDTLRISCEAFDARVVGTTPSRVLVEWPWLQIDEESENDWDGTFGFPRDPDAYDWCNTPWRLEPDPSELETGDMCLVGIPSTLVQIMEIERYDPPADLGFLPRPEYALGLCPVDMLDDEEAGYTIYLNSGEPIEFEVVESADR